MHYTGSTLEAYKHGVVPQYAYHSAKMTSGFLQSSACIVNA